MYLNGNTFSKILVLVAVFIALAACAPKKVRLYGASDSLRNDIVGSALSLQGKPYKNAAKGPDAFDCSGFVYYVFKQHRVFLPPPAAAQGRAGYEVGRNGVQPGDLVIFRIDGDFHIGIVLSGGDFIHASKSRGVAIDNIDTVYWRRQLVGYRSVL